MTTIEQIIQGLIQGIIQGLTEFLPVSSSGHLTLWQLLTGSETSESFLLSAFLHLGTLVAICVAFWSTVKSLACEGCSVVKDLFTGKLVRKGMDTPERRMLYMMLLSLLVLIPFYFLRDLIESVAKDYPVALGCFFLYTCVILFLSDFFNKGSKGPGEITWKDALIIGLFQAVALLPGVSRSGSTICAGLFIGMNRDSAVKYSFMLGIPTILAGCLVEIKDALDEDALPMDQLPMFLIGFAVAAAVGILAIRMVNLLVKSNKFKYFALYTLLIGMFTIGWGIYGLVH